MLDHRINTFLTLCETLSYTKCAEALQMTQPGVTQHIKFLEASYGCQLFKYENRMLSLTPEGSTLAAHLRQAAISDANLRQQLIAPKKRPLSMGATKTVGDYVINDLVQSLASDESIELTLAVDNTDILLHKLTHFELDLAIIEGNFDKNLFAHKRLRKESFVGICAKNHPFAGKIVKLSELFSEHILLREEGSGTRAIFERMLAANHYSVDAFASASVISSFPLICQLAEGGVGISFVYEAIANANPQLATFRVSANEMRGEYNLVYLPQFEGEPWYVNHVRKALS